MYKLILTIFILHLGSSLWAQVRPRDQEFTIAMPSRILVINDEQSPATGVLETQGSPTRKFTFPEWAMVVDFFDERFWAYKVEKPSPSVRKLMLFSSPDGKGWHYEAEYVEEDIPRIQSIRPIDSNYFLLTAWGGFESRGKSSPLAIGKRQASGRIEIVDFIELPISGPYVEPGKREPKSGTAAGDKLGISRVNPKYMPIWFTLGKDFVVRSNIGLVVPSFETGFIWVINGSETGTPKVKQVSVFKSVSKDLLESGKRLEYGILGMQPSPNGSILIAARTEEATLKSAERFPSLPYRSSGDPAKDAEHESKLHANFEGSLKAYPEIEWWTLDPTTGAIRPEEPPMNVPRRIETWDEFKNFRFRFKPNGNLLVSYN